MRIPLNLEGTYHIITKADYTNYIPESDEGNNIDILQLQITRLWPDLVVTSITGPAGAKSDEVITVTATVKNTGEVRTGRNFRQGFWLSKDNVLGSGDTFLGEKWIGELGAGAEAAVGINVRIPLNIEGTYHIITMADYANNIPESSDANNTGGYQIEITSTP